MSAASSAFYANLLASVAPFHPDHTCRFKYYGVWYSSVSHAMASIHFEDKSRWASGGEFDNWEEILADINEECAAEGKDKETFHGMGTLIGILARHVKVRPRRYNLKPIEEYGWARWKHTLAAVYAAKFMPNGKFNELGVKLLHTTGLIEIPGRLSIFGEVLAKWRDEWKGRESHGKRKRGTDDGIEFLKKRTIEDKFAEAQASGSMVDLASDLSDEPMGEIKVTRKNFLEYYSDWEIKKIVRKSGASAGHVDYQYISPCGKVFRSIKQAQRFAQ